MSVEPQKKGFKKRRDAQADHAFLSFPSFPCVSSQAACVDHRASFLFLALDSVAWYARVPSASNIADGSSRGDLAGVPAKFLPSLLVDVTVSHCLSKLTNDVSGDDP